MNRSAPGIARSSCTSTPSMSMSQERIARSATPRETSGASSRPGEALGARPPCARAGRPAVALDAPDERDVIGTQPLARPHRAQLAEEQVELGAERRVRALDARRAG